MPDVFQSVPRSSAVDGLQESIVDDVLSLVERLKDGGVGRLLLGQLLQLDQQLSQSRVVAFRLARRRHVAPTQIHGTVNSDYTQLKSVDLQVTSCSYNGSV